MRHRMPPSPVRTELSALVVAPVTPLVIAPAIALAITLVVALVIGLGGCGGSDGGDDPESTGVRDRAVEQLRDYGLPADQAECVVEALGAETVAATGDMEVLAAGQEYRDAIEGCPA